jgi:glycosyltransferase involved in cell wall biosynthesis
VLERAAGTVATGAATELHHAIAAYDAVVDWAPDVVHDHTLVGPVYGRQFGLPIVTTNHGPFDSELAALYRAIASEVAVVAISHHHASTARGIPLAGVIHHGVDVDAFPLGDGDRGYLLFLGRMSADKGVDLAVDIARSAGVPLRIAAKMREPAEIAFFETSIAPLLGDTVEYVGEVGGRDKLDLLAGARALLNPIRWPEPFGMVMIEALACGTPVLATAKGSAPEIVEHGVTGFVGTPPQLTAAVARLAEIDRRECRKSAAERFSTHRMVTDHVRLYERMAASRPRDARCR